VATACKRFDGARSVSAGQAADLEDPVDLHHQIAQVKRL
jgi:hypothetical protein